MDGFVGQMRKLEMPDVTPALMQTVIDGVFRRAKADFPLVPLCPVKSMAPVPAIAGMVARAVDTTAV
jgi:hypothetical protein